MDKKFAFVLATLIATTLNAEVIEDTVINRISRAEWNAQPADVPNLSLEKGKKTRFIIGHTATPMVAQTRLGAELLAKHVQDFHMAPAPKGKGFADMGYHFLVGDGMIVEGRTLEAMPSCYLGQNSGSVCGAFMGCFDDACSVAQSVTEAMLVAMGVAIAEHAWQLGIKDLSRDNIKGFSELGDRFPLAPGNRIMNKDETGVAPFDKMIQFAVRHMMRLHAPVLAALEENEPAKTEL